MKNYHSCAKIWKILLYLWCIPTKRQNPRKWCCSRFNVQIATSTQFLHFRLDQSNLDSTNLISNLAKKNPLELLARKSTLEPKHRRAKDLIQPAFSIPKLKLFVRIELKLCSTYVMGLIQNLCRNLTNDKRRHSQLNTFFEQNRNVHLKKWTASKLYIWQVHLIVQISSDGIQSWEPLKQHWWYNFIPVAIRMVNSGRESVWKRIQFVE